ncbi:MAG: metallophosphoesterase [Candidatus Riflebacteria bacterium]|nr:metallophosphoesterase [Candidatus Riflebacteria bacterium]
MSRAGQGESHCVRSGSRYGVISDTHGKLSPRVFQLFHGVDGIIHGGDFCDEDVLESLRAIAPVFAVHGNCDRFPLVTMLPKLGVFTLAGQKVVVVHELGRPEWPLPSVRSALKAECPRVVVFGHSHRPCAVEAGGVLYFNPGSPTVVRDPGVDRSVGYLDLSPDAVSWELVSLGDECRKGRPTR